MLKVTIRPVLYSTLLFPAPYPVVPKKPKPRINFKPTSFCRQISSKLVQWYSSESVTGRHIFDFIILVWRYELSVTRPSVIGWFSTTIFFNSLCNNHTYLSYSEKGNKYFCIRQFFLAIKCKKILQIRLCKKIVYICQKISPENLSRTYLLFFMTML